MSATIGKVNEFDALVNNWDEYVEQLEQFFLANDIEDENKKKAVLLSSCGNKSYALFKNLVSPDKPKDKSLAELVKVMKDHVHPKPSVIMERFKFYKRDREPSENVSTYMAELKKLSRDCDFQTTLNDMLRDRLVCGVRNDKIQQRLLSEATLTLEQAITLAMAVERAQHNLKDLNEVQDLPNVHMLLKKSTPAFKKGFQKCFRCGKQNHQAAECRFRNAECFVCSKRGHIATVCDEKEKSTSSQSKSTSNRYGANHLMYDETTQDIKSISIEDVKEDEITYPIYTMRHKKISPFNTTVKLNGISVGMEIDTGASLSIINQSVFGNLQRKDKSLTLQSTPVKFRTYTGETMKPLGVTDMLIEYRSQKLRQPVFVVAGNVPCLLGRDLLTTLKLNWEEIFHTSTATNITSITTEEKLKKLLKEYEDIFADELGTLKGYQAHIKLKDGAEPRYLKARPVPYALRKAIEVEIDRQVRDGVLEPVEVSEWATPIVPVVKSDKTVRICGDYKLTLNPAAQLDNYPIPTPEDIFATFAGGEKFSKIDFAHAYEQVLLDEPTREVATLNTHKGLYRPTRLTHGIHSAPGIFQRKMEEKLEPAPFRKVRIDDALLSGEEDDAHLKNLESAFAIIREAGLRLKLSKCLFMQDDVEYLGYRINKYGITPVEEKVKAIRDAPQPQTVTELKSFLGLLNYYHRYISSAATILEPLHQLLRKERKWRWGKEQQKAFEEVKSCLSSSSLLVHYDPEKELLMSCDASPYGLGVVLSHRMDDGSERPIAYASKTLTIAQKGYSHLQKEALAVVYGVVKFHQYCYGRHFEIFSDHKPLEGIFAENKPIPTLAASRLQRWAIILSAYDYEFKYKKGVDNGNADALSRLPLPGAENEEIDEESTYEAVNLTELERSPVTANEVKNYSRRDPLIGKIIDIITRNRRTELKQKEFSKFSDKSEELTVEDGCLLWGSRVVIPEMLKVKVLEELHQSHVGITRMKSLARSYVWWPHMDKDLEELVQECDVCQFHQNSPKQAPLHHWEWTTEPWQRIHIDFADFEGKSYLVVVDSHSKWLEVALTRGESSLDAIDALRKIFATHGLPDFCVSDNAAAFLGEEFQMFMSKNGIRHITSAPYHPSSNGQAERFVETFKNGMKKTPGDSNSMKLQRFLFSYRTLPHSTTGASPAELLMGRRLKTALDLLKPCRSNRMNEKNYVNSPEMSKEQVKQFPVNSKVFVKNFAPGPKWLPAVVVGQTGPVSYLVALQNGREVRRHVDHMRKNSSKLLDKRIQSNEKQSLTTFQPEITISDPNIETARETPNLSHPQVSDEYEDEESEQVEEPRRSTRASVKPDRYGDNVYD